MCYSLGMQQGDRVLAVRRKIAAHHYDGVNAWNDGAQRDFYAQGVNHFQSLDFAEGLGYTRFLAQMGAFMQANTGWEVQLLLERVEDRLKAVDAGG